MTNAQYFTKYVSGWFYNDLFKALQKKADYRNDSRPLLYEMEVKSVRINDEVGMRICFDVVVEATYALIDGTELSTVKWHQFSCWGKS